MGDTPIIGVGIKVTPETRAVLLSVCTTSEECIRLQAYAHAQTTPSTRTYSMAAHALNSLFWKSVEDPLVQNSIIFMAEEMVIGLLIRDVMLHSNVREHFSLTLEKLTSNLA